MNYRHTNQTPADRRLTAAMGEPVIRLNRAVRTGSARRAENESNRPATGAETAAVVFGSILAVAVIALALAMISQ